MIKPGLLVVLSGPSGVGKDTVLKEFLRHNPDCVLSISATTRQPRPGEEPGRDYFFMSTEKFGGLVAQGEMLEYAEYAGNYYGTPRDFVDTLLAQGKNVILEIEVKGAMQIKETRPDAVFVFVMPPSFHSLQERLSKRNTEPSWALKKRLKAARFEIAHATEYDYIIVNDSVEECRRSLESVIAAAALSTPHMKEFLEEVYRDA